MNKPLVSVVVPVYRAEPFLHKCLDSIIGQSYTRMEIILVDDGSPDMSGSICEEYARSDPRINVIHQKNEGVSCARNAGMDCAAGQLVTFVDADDWLEPGHIEILVRGCESRDCSICGFWVENRGSSIQWKAERPENLSAEAAMERLLSPVQFQGSVCNKLFRTALIHKAGIRFREDISYMEDLLFCANYFSLCKSVFCSDQATYHYRQHPASAVGNMRVSEKWLHGRMTALDALNGVRAVCHSPAAVKLCRAREQTEYMEILLRLMKARAMRDKSRWLTHKMRTGIGSVLFSALPAKIKAKYVFVTLCPRLYCKSVMFRNKRRK